jgi:hypothetical protein
MPPQMYATLPRWIASLAARIVVTWGFPPYPECIAIIEHFRQLGFTPWWFSAQYDLARQRYLAREGQQATEQFFDPQIERLQEAKAQLDAIYQDQSLETLTPDGYKPVEHIYDAIAANVA